MVHVVHTHHGPQVTPVHTWVHTSGIPTWEENITDINPLPSPEAGITTLTLPVYASLCTLVGVLLYIPSLCTRVGIHPVYASLRLRSLSDLSHS